jgi:hypothetical protein
MQDVQGKLPTAPVPFVSDTGSYEFDVTTSCNSTFSSSSSTHAVSRAERPLITQDIFTTYVFQFRQQRLIELILMQTETAFDLNHYLLGFRLLSPYCRGYLYEPCRPFISLYLIERKVNAAYFLKFITRYRALIVREKTLFNEVVSLFQTHMFANSVR